MLVVDRMKQFAGLRFLRVTVALFLHGLARFLLRVAVGHVLDVAIALANLCDEGRCRRLHDREAVDLRAHVGREPVVFGMQLFVQEASTAEFAVARDRGGVDAEGHPVQPRDVFLRQGNVTSGGGEGDQGKQECGGERSHVISVSGGYASFNGARAGRFTSRGRTGSNGALARPYISISSSPINSIAASRFPAVSSATSRTRSPTLSFGTSTSTVKVREPMSSESSLELESSRTPMAKSSISSTRSTRSMP